MRITTSLIFIAILTSIFSSCSENLSKNNSANLNEVNKNNVPEVVDLVEPLPFNSENVNMANFIKIKNGMTLDEVEKILETPGTNSTNDENVAKGESVYEFVAPDEKGKIIVTLKNDKVVAKKEFNLK